MFAVRNRSGAISEFSPLLIPPLNLPIYLDRERQRVKRHFLLSLWIICFWTFRIAFRVSRIEILDLCIYSLSVLLCVFLQVLLGPSRFVNNSNEFLTRNFRVDTRQIFWWQNGSRQSCGGSIAGDPLQTDPCADSKKLLVIQTLALSKRIQI